MARMLFKYILLAIAILFSYSSMLSAQERIEFDGFYIGQPFWDVYTNFKRITNDNTIPKSIKFGGRGIDPVFDKDLNLILIKISPSVYIKEFDIYKFDMVKSFVDGLLSNTGIGKFKTVDIVSGGNNFKEYILEDNNSRLSFTLSDKQVPALNSLQGEYPGFLSPIILEKKLDRSGPVVNGIQLGMPVFEAKEALKSKQYPWNIILDTTFTITDKTTYINNINYFGSLIPLFFGVDKVDSNFIDQFINAYKIDVNEIPYSTFLAQTKFDSTYLKGNLKVYEGKSYYLIFKLSTGETRDNGIVAMIYKDFVEFVPPALPPHNNAPTFN